MSEWSSSAIEGGSGAAIPTIANKGCDVAPIAAPTLEIYTARRVPPPSGSWSSGYDIALTQRRSPVRIRSSPLRFRFDPPSVCDRRGEGRDQHRHQGEARQRD